MVIMPGAVVTLAADSSLIDTVWFVKPVTVCLSQEDKSMRYWLYQDLQHVEETVLSS